MISSKAPVGSTFHDGERLPWLCMPHTTAARPSANASSEPAPHVVPHLIGSRDHGSIST